MGCRGSLVVFPQRRSEAGRTIARIDALARELHREQPADPAVQDLLSATASTGAIVAAALRRSRSLGAHHVTSLPAA